MEAKIGKHILMYLGNNPYPNDTRVRPEAVSLAKAGYTVSVISPKRWDQSFFEEREGVKAYRYPAPPELDSVLGYGLEYGLTLFFTFLFTLYIFFRHGFDVIHAHNPPDIFVLLAFIFKQLGKKFVFDHHDLSVDLYRARTDGNGSKWIINTLTWFEKMTCRTADLIITTNQSYKRLDAERHNIPPERIKVVRNGVNLKRLRMVEPLPRLAAMDRTIIGFVGSMGPQDGVDNMLRVLNHLRYTLGRDDFYAVLVGEGSELEMLQTMAEKLGLSDLVAFVGKQRGESLNAYYSSMDIGIEPTEANSFNNHSTMIKVMEYMAFRIPLVAFDLPEHRVTAKEAAVYTPDHDLHDMALQIANLMDDPTRREQMGNYGRQRVMEKLTWQHSAKKLLKAYDLVFPKHHAAQRLHNALE